MYGDRELKWSLSQCPIIYGPDYIYPCVFVLKQWAKPEVTAGEHSAGDVMIF